MPKGPQGQKLPPNSGARRSPVRPLAGFCSNPELQSRRGVFCPQRRWEKLTWAYLAAT
jgi:hypothetical protein